uniref:DDE Tnp4 domain-containing protein n=1 Tax=Plectus sambesii TaxID=2011161 RepID=A0A914VMG6_9BILA
MRALAAPTVEGEHFYAAHAKTRRIVECAFGILKIHFRCLYERIRVKDHVYACEIIKACTVLHNLALKTDPVDVEDALDDMDVRAVHGAYLNAYGLESETPTEEDEDHVSIRDPPEYAIRSHHLIQLFKSVTT